MPFSVNRDNTLVRWATIVPLGIFIFLVAGANVKVFFAIFFGCAALGVAIGLLQRLVYWAARRREARADRP